MKIKRYKKSQEFRVVMCAESKIAFSVYVRADDIRRGIGGDYWCNAALQKALDALEYSRSGKGCANAAMGISGIWEGRSVDLQVKNRV